MSHTIPHEKIHVVYASAQVQGKYWKKILDTGKVEGVSDPIVSESMVRQAKNNLEFWQALMTFLEKSQELSSDLVLSVG